MYLSLRLLRPGPAIRPLFAPAIHRPALTGSFSPRRLATSTSSGGSGKETPSSHGDKTKHASHNETGSAGAEIRGITSDVAQMISGRSGKTKSENPMRGANEISSHSHPGSVRNDFLSITTSIVQEVPRPAMVVGLAGTLPYLGTSLGTIFLAREASRASLGETTITGLDLPSALSNLHVLEHVQITYGAIILSFLGAIHWGMEFSKLGGEFGYRRLALGVIPVLYAWPTTFLAHGPALIAQWLGFTGTWLLDQRASTNGWTTSWYATYRFYLSIVVGISIMATFAGTGYYGAGAGAITDVKSKRPHATERTSALKRLDRVGEKNHPTNDLTKVGKVTGVTHGDYQVDEGEDSYLKLRNIKEEKEVAEEAKQKQEEKKKNAEFQDKRDEKQQDKAPGSMKDTAKDRTGRNANMPGGAEERPDEEKQKLQTGKDEGEGSDKAEKNDKGDRKKDSDKGDKK